MKWIPSVFVAILAGVLLGVLAYFLALPERVSSSVSSATAQLQPSSDSSSRPSPVQQSPVPHPSTSDQVGEPAPESERFSLPDPPPPKPRLTFPPTIPPCPSGDPDQLLTSAISALENRLQSRAGKLLEQAAACGGPFALSIATVFDPAQELTRSIPPDFRKALKYYAYAAAQGKDQEALSRLGVLREKFGKNSWEAEEIDALSKAIQSAR